MKATRETLLVEMALTIIEANVGGFPGESFLSTEPTECIHAVVEVYVDNWLTEFD